MIFSIRICDPNRVAPNIDLEKKLRCVDPGGDVGLAAESARSGKLPGFLVESLAMKNGIICAWLFFAGILSTQGQDGQASITTKIGNVTVSNTEPARITLVSLFKIADVVAVVRIVSGDTENYKTAVYKACLLYTSRCV